MSVPILVLYAAHDPLVFFSIVYLSIEHALVCFMKNGTCKCQRAPVGLHFTFQVTRLALSAGPKAFRLGGWIAIHARNWRQSRTGSKAFSTRASQRSSASTVDGNESKRPVFVGKPVENGGETGSDLSFQPWSSCHHSLSRVVAAQIHRIISYHIISHHITSHHILYKACSYMY